MVFVSKLPTTYGTSAFSVHNYKIQKNQEPSTFSVQPRKIMKIDVFGLKTSKTQGTSTFSFQYFKTTE
jgi:hypothetical protein